MELLQENNRKLKKLGFHVGAYVKDKIFYLLHRRMNISSKTTGYGPTKRKIWYDPITNFSVHDNPNIGKKEARVIIAAKIVCSNCRGCSSCQYAEICALKNERITVECSECEHRNKLGGCIGKEEFAGFNMYA